MSDHEIDPEGPSDEDLERFGGETVTCPSCGNDVYDEASVCQVCGEVLSETGGAGAKPWVILVGAAALVAFVLVMTR